MFLGAPNIDPSLAERRTFFSLSHRERQILGTPKLPLLAASSKE